MERSFERIYPGFRKLRSKTEYGKPWRCSSAYSFCAAGNRVW